jgi:hypothetical protein
MAHQSTQTGRMKLFFKVIHLQQFEDIPLSGLLSPPGLCVSICLAGPHPVNQTRLYFNSGRLGKNFHSQN